VGIGAGRAPAISKSNPAISRSGWTICRRSQGGCITAASSAGRSISSPGSKYAPEHNDAFEDLVLRLRRTPEWRYVDREVDIRLART